MVAVGSNTDEVTSSPVTISPDSNNPFEVVQTSTLETVGTDPDEGVARDGFELSVDQTIADLPESVNIVLVIDQSGSTSGSSGTDFNGDNVDETILQAELFAANEVFQAYIDAGYDPNDVTISVVTYESTGDEQVRGSFTLDEQDDFIDALDTINTEGSGGQTSFVGGLSAAEQAFADVGASNDPTVDTNIVLFLSDGVPVPGGQDIAGAASSLETAYNPTIFGIGLGQNSDVTPGGGLDILDNSDVGPVQVLSGEQLLNVVVAPLADTQFEEFQVLVEGIDMDGNAISETIIVSSTENSQFFNSTQLNVQIDCLPIDQDFMVGSEVTVTVTGFWAEDPPGSANGLQPVVTTHTLDVLVCFTLGTQILTPAGPVSIETLEIGDRVVTRDHGVQEIRWIGATILPSTYAANNPHLFPILIKKDALGPNTPDADLRVSRQHRVLVRDWRAEVMFGDPTGVLVPAHSLCNDSTIRPERPDGTVTYVHMAFDNHEVVYANGVEAESFHPAERTVAALNSEQRAELLEIFPHLAESDLFAYDSARPELRGKDARVLAVG